MSSLPLVGDEFAGYRLRSVLGRGGMSVVFQAENPRIGSLVALKVLAPELATDDMFRARFLQESRIAASLNHPHVIPIYDMGPSGDLLYIAMRYVAGSDLRTILHSRDRLSPSQSVLLMHQAARALDHAHRSGLVHRDVKPANFLVQRGVDDDPDHVYLADFGISKHTFSRTGLTPTGQFMGTIDYIAPEQVQGRAVDGRADIYSLGCVMYEALTGQVPFVRDADAAVIWAHVEDTPALPSQVRPELGNRIDPVMERVLAKDPDQRYQTAREFVEAARSALQADDPKPQTVLAGPTVPWSGAPPAATMPASDPAASGASFAGAGGGTGGTGGGDGGGDGGLGRSDAPRPSEPDPRTTPAKPPGRAKRVALPLIMAVLVLLAVGGVWFGLSSRSGSDGSSKSAAGGMKSQMPSSSGSSSPSTNQGNPILGALDNTNKSAEAKGLLPPSKCHAVSSDVVTCSMPAYGAHAVTFRTYKTLPELYQAYEKAAVAMGGHAFQENVDDCSRRGTSGEVSWDHSYHHHHEYSVMDMMDPKLDPSHQAAGRLFCTLHGSSMQIVWTMNDGQMLGILDGSGYAHTDTFRWWRRVHHNINLAGDMGSMNDM